MGVQQALDLGKRRRTSLAVVWRYREYLEFHGGGKWQRVWRECNRQSRFAEWVGEICRTRALERPRYARGGEWGIDAGGREVPFYFVVYAGRAADGGERSPSHVHGNPAYPDE